MDEVVVLLGANLGDVRGMFAKVRNRLCEDGFKIKAASHLYSSPAWGFESQDPFLNQALIVRVGIDPTDFLDYILDLEHREGRIRKDDGAYQSRPLDIDIMFWGSAVIDNDRLSVPHPRMAQRKFALIPLVELIPDFVHPVLNESLRNLLSRCEDVSPVVKLDE